jgi:hypothetical protein
VDRSSAGLAGVTFATSPLVADAPPVSRIDEVLRDISRGGLAGILIGVFGGVGARIVMRLDALLLPDTVGAFTSNGNRIGDITIGGTLALVLGGVIAGLQAGTIWVAVSPWIPRTGLARAVLTMPIVVAIAGPGLIEGDNPDFLVLHFDPIVVALLIALVAICGFVFALVDDWLERRLPHLAPGQGRVTPMYAIVTILGFLTLPINFMLIVFDEGVVQPVGITFVSVGLVTVAWWVLRLFGRPRRPPILVWAGRLALTGGVILGYAALWPEVLQALDLA